MNPKFELAVCKECEKTFIRLKQKRHRTSQDHLCYTCRKEVVEPEEDGLMKDEGSVRVRRMLATAGCLMHNRKATPDDVQACFRKIGI